MAPANHERSGSGLKIVIIVLALLLLGAACGCLFGGSILATVAAALGGAANAPKTYYPACERLDGDACGECCQQHGHSGYAAGSMLNEGGRSCGCL